MTDKRFFRLAIVVLCLALSPTYPNTAQAADAPVPMLKRGQPVDWWFVFKLNSAHFPGCGPITRACIFGGDVQDYAHFGQQFVYASSDNHVLQKGEGCAGDTVKDPLGTTFDEVYHGDYNYLIWNDQFYDDPKIDGCTESCSGPWGHSKGMLAWNDEGEGYVLQVTTPSWPAAGNKDHRRQSDGNTLGCVHDNDVLVSQHFFALKLTKDDLLKVLRALQNASVVTDVGNPQVVNVRAPEDVKALIGNFGVKSDSKNYIKETLSSGVILISKPSALHVPPWQMVSALLGGVPLRTATWWTNPKIYSTTSTTQIACWDDALGKPGAVEIATTGEWGDEKFGLEGGLGQNFNHAKIGVSTEKSAHYTIFGDMNQQGASREGQNCGSSQNGRGGLFYVIDDAALAESVTKLIAGGSAPSNPPPQHTAN
jgi:hypothetical protein